jgi:hypothetical protein
MNRSPLYLRRPSLVSVAPRATWVWSPRALTEEISVLLVHPRSVLPCLQDFLSLARLTGLRLFPLRTNTAPPRVIVNT